MPVSRYKSQSGNATEVSSLVELARLRAARQPNREAFIFLKNGETKSSSLTFGELDRRSRSVAARLRQYWEPGQRVLLAHAHGSEFVVAFFGCLYAGLVAVPTAPSVGSTDILRLRRTAADAGAAGVCLGREQFDSGALALPGAQPQLRCVITSDDAGEFAPQWVEPALGPASLALLQYGAGASKGVMVNHGNLLHNQQLIARCFGHSARTVGVSWLPLHHDMGLIGHLLQPLYLGCTSVLMSPAAFLAKPVRWLQAISDYRATTSGGPNFAYELCVRRIRAEQTTGLDLSHWQVAFNGAEMVRSETLARFADKFAMCRFSPAAFTACYGLAAATLFVSGTPKARGPAVCTLDIDEMRRSRVEPAIVSRRVRTVVSCGPVGGQQALIVEPATCEPCASDRIGEIWLRGASVAAGYWNQAELSRATFGATLAGSGEGPFLRTGDLGFVRDGELYVTGKLAELIKFRGLHHYPHDIENTIRTSHPRLKSGAGVAVFVVSRRLGRRLIVMHEIERNELGRIPRSQILSSARGALLERHGLKLHDIVYLPEGRLPRSASGKILRDACPAVV